MTVEIRDLCFFFFTHKFLTKFWSLGRKILQFGHCSQAICLEMSMAFSYLKSLSKMSNASGLIKCWFSLWTKRPDLFRECLKIVSPILFDTCLGTQRVLLCRELCPFEPTDRNCHDHEKRVLWHKRHTESFWQQKQRLRIRIRTDIFILQIIK